MKYGITNSDWADISAGEFMMGSPKFEKFRADNECEHHVEVSSFKMLKTPVTIAMYDYFCDATGRNKPYDEGWGRSKRPVIHVNYWDAVDYCEWLSKECDMCIRLPTEAEWEYACRAGTSTPFWMGETISTDQANYNGNYIYGNGSEGIVREMTTPVDKFQANLWGLYDMHGNVWEWCASEYNENYDGMESQNASGDRSNKSDRVLRSGSWLKVPWFLRSALRFGLHPIDESFDIGFRLVRD